MITAAVCRAFGDPLDLEPVVLRPAGPDEVGVTVTACAICHSDVTYMRGSWGGGLPAVYGHEAAGVVDEVGPGVVDVEQGDAVVVTLVRYCGRCRMCLRGTPALCERWPSLPLSLDSPLRSASGEIIQQGARTAAFAERVVVHASQVVPVPPELPAAAASLLACGVVTGVGAVLNTAHVEAGATVGVIGAGGVGLNAVQGAAIAGAALVVAVDLVPAKLAVARTLGATDVLDARTDVGAAVHELTGGRGLDYVFVTAAAAAAVEQALPLVARGGALVLVGMPPAATVTIVPEEIADGGIRILGSKMGSTRPQLDIPALVALYREGRLKLDELVSDRFPLAAINDAVAAATGGEALRPVVVF